MSFRTVLSIITLLLIAVIIYFSRDELVHAWELLGQVNVWILLLLIPGQLLVYYATGEMIFSYLRTKKSIAHIKPWTLARLSLELNFVNHILPSGGVSGVSYLSWRLKKFGVSTGRATMAQVVRFAAGFMAYLVLLAACVIAVTIDGRVNRWIILASAILTGLMIGTIVGAVYIMSSQRRLKSFAGWSTRTINNVVRRLTFGRRGAVLERSKLEDTFMEMHDDLQEIQKDKRVLIKPFLWGLVMNAADAGLFIITFLAFGQLVNPALIVIGYGVAALAGVFVLTPGGAGAYEAVMVAFLSLAGLSSGVAIAGILLTRVILLLGTIGLGYVFYQMAILHRGKRAA